MVASIWSGDDFGFISKDASGQSGGLLSVWNQDLLDVQFSFSGEHFLGLCAKIQDTLCYLVNVYSACSVEGKRQLWGDLQRLKGEFDDGLWCVAGDFNAVLSREERRGASNSSYLSEIRELEAFKDDMELVDVPVLGKKFTYFGPDGKSMSRVGRFLLSEGFVSRWNISAEWVGDRDISDHCPIWLVSSNLNWGPKPFRFNNCWLEHKDFMKVVRDSWLSSGVEGRGYFVL